MTLRPVVDTDSKPPLPQRRKPELSQAQKDGDACLLCGIAFKRLGDRKPFGDGCCCVDSTRCAKRRADNYRALKASSSDHSSRSKDGHGVGEMTVSGVGSLEFVQTDVVTSKTDGA